jgi:hypothetical protein
MYNLTIAPMTADFIVWRCLHGGPLSRAAIDRPAPHPRIDWPSIRARNVPLLERLIRTYGSCAMVARDGEDVVGTLRFYPKELCAFGEGGAAFCLQQAYPAGPRDDMAARPWPAREEMREKILFVHCLMVAAPEGEPGRYRRRGLATRMARELARWAREEGWEAIEAAAYEEIPWLYANAGVAGRRFWEKLGFRIVHEDSEPAMSGELLEVIRKSAAEAGLPPEKTTNRYWMRREVRAG